MTDTPSRDLLLDALASNPSLPLELLGRVLAGGGGHGVASRADLTEDLIEAVLASGDHWALRALARNPALPQPERLRLADHPDARVRADNAGSADGGPRELYARFAADPVCSVRERLARNETAPVDLRAGLAEDPHPHVRVALAQWWTAAPEAVRRRLLTDADASVRAAACGPHRTRQEAPAPPADLVPALLADPATRAGAVGHCALDAATAARLAADPDHEVRRALADRPDLPPELLARLAGDPHPLVSVRVFSRPDTPEALRAAIHERIATAPDPWAAGLTDDERELRIAGFGAAEELVAANLPWVAADPLPHLDSPYEAFRASAAAAAGLPAARVARLLEDDSGRVRIAAARAAPHLVDAATAERLDRTYRAGRLGWRPADDFPLPAAALRRLAEDPDPRMRVLAPRDPELPAELARRLATDPDAGVRTAVAAHPNLPEASIVALLSDEEAWIGPAANPSLPVRAMLGILEERGC